MKNAFLLFSLTVLSISAVTAAEVDVQISTREAYVGSPLVLQLTIADASDFERPADPIIDGCEVRSAGAPSQSSQITIINGRRTESRSVVMRYLITPRREGTFTIPPMTLNVDGKNWTTQAKQFVATRSETGDLMFVQIEGSKQKVFVGQPIDLKLRIWIKPFRDPETGLTLSEGDMWNMISNSTSWGSFNDRMRDLEANRQRPGGEEVLRDDGAGNKRAYYLYEINATVYPKRPGKIDASDVQIVLNYPTALGKTRSRIESIFDDDMFGGNSMMSRMLNDDFFDSPFGNRMSVTATRPIAGEVTVDATEVLPVPSEGRPANYRGAVGRYQIVTQATPTTVDAGDPITLNIGIAGTGPMDLVQAPPLFEQSNLTNAFKVADDSLAGFVQDSTKVFSTTIRPRREGITEIPPVEFSFFDPDTEQFQTVSSDPIPITVLKSETLALDSIVSGTRNKSTNNENTAIDMNLPDFTNHGGTHVLLTRAPMTRSNWWWIASVVAPPLAWLMLAFTKYRSTLFNRLPSFRSPRTVFLMAMKRAPDAEAFADAVVQYVLSRVPQRKRDAAIDRKTAAASTTNPNNALTNNVDLEIAAVGRLRVAGLYQVAGEVESFLAACHRADGGIVAESAIELVERVDAALQTNHRAWVRPRSVKGSKVDIASPLSLLFLALLSSAFTVEQAAAQSVPPGKSHLTELTAASAETLLDEANESYNQGLSQSQSDSASAKDLITASISKYRLLVDSGIRNPELYINLANAYLQTGKLGYAIANYEKALQIDPDNSQAAQNLAFANRTASLPVKPQSTSQLRAYNDALTRAVGKTTIQWTLAASSLLFWGLLGFRLHDRSLPLGRVALVPLCLFLVTLGSLFLTQTNASDIWNAVIVGDSVTMRSGDGEEFQPVMQLSPSQGRRVKTLLTRGSWTQIRVPEGQLGWVYTKDLESVQSD